jgi:hypothetical protein
LVLAVLAIRAGYAMLREDDPDSRSPPVGK